MLALGYAVEAVAVVVGFGWSRAAIQALGNDSTAYSKKPVLSP